MMEAIDMRPAKVHAVLAGVTETVGGGLLAAGLGTPLASAALTGVMTTAIKKVHLPNGPWASKGGWEYNAVLIAALTALAETGPGKLSLDHLLGTERSGTRWALAAVGTGVATAFLTMAVGRHRGRASSAHGQSPAADAEAAVTQPEAGDQPSAAAA
jgi:putative oxidoreductase